MKLCTGGVQIIREGNMIHTFENIRPDIHPEAWVAEDAQVIGRVSLARAASIWFGCVVRGDVNFIEIGERTNVQDHTTIHVSRDTHPTILENDVTVGHRVVLHGCTVEPECLIGIGAIVLDGAVIGEGSVVGAMSLVTPGTRVPPGSVVMGQPGRVVRQATEADRDWIRRSTASYVGLSETYRRSP